MASDACAAFERVAAGAGLGDEYVKNLVKKNRCCQCVWGVAVRVRRRWLVVAAFDHRASMRDLANR